MKVKYYLFLLFFLIAGCTSVSTKQVDLINKGLITVNMTLIDFEERNILKPKKIYFIKLEESSTLRSKSIISSDQVDANGNIFINPSPGLYAIVAADRYIGNILTRTIFEDETIKITITDIQAGQTKHFDLRFLDYSKTIFDKIPETTKYYHRILKPQFVDFFEFKIGKNYPTEKTLKPTIDKTKEDISDVKIEQY